MLSIKNNKYKFCSYSFISSTMSKGNKWEAIWKYALSIFINMLNIKNSKYNF